MPQAYWSAEPDQEPRTAECDSIKFTCPANGLKLSRKAPFTNVLDQTTQWQAQPASSWCLLSRQRLWGRLRTSSRDHPHNALRFKLRNHPALYQVLGCRQAQFASAPAAATNVTRPTRFRAAQVSPASPRDADESRDLREQQQRFWAKSELDSIAACTHARDLVIDIRFNQGGRVSFASGRVFVGARERRRAGHRDEQLGRTAKQWREEWAQRRCKVVQRELQV